WVYPTFAFSSGQKIFLDARTMITPKKLVLNFDCESATISASSLLNFDAYAKLRNQVDVLCINQAGYAGLRLADMFANIGKSVMLNLAVPNSRTNHSKGTLTVTCQSITMDGNAKPRLGVLKKDQRHRKNSIR